ncbi:TonB-dependent receptor [Aliifodinibius salicampi]|uniref:TonB-dependent receptor n=1 Tax=Fodinibius salicampi TaxID=1920655 RepID=A0ABT3PVY9_9BACT|nr:TonB-dependent receptor [Fodinibius salicampi]MCW9712012.1 TonB-dependent receptor [Fodinibius salicampi]
MLNKEILLFLFLVIPAWFNTVNIVLGQDATMQGIITRENTGEPMYGANVALRSLSDEDVLGTAADSDGFYRIGSIEPDTYAIQITYIGYKTYEDTLAFEAGENYTLNVALQPGDAELGEVVIEQSTGAVMRDEGSQRISPVDLGRIPSPALGDLSTYIQTLQGVVALGDRGGQVFIRGGTPSQNLVLLDGAMIYRPSHIVGFFSPFPKNIISGVDFYAGGFGPRYNSRVSSVMDIQLRHGDRNNFAGSASISPFAGELFFEGPLKEGKASWMLSARNSLIERTSAGVYPIDDQPLKFGSQLLKVSFPGQNDRCSAMIMHTYDRGRMDFEVDESIKWRNFALGGNCVVLPENSRTLMQSNVNISSFSNSLINEEGFGFSSNIWRVNVDINLRQYVGDTRLNMVSLVV